MNFYRVNYQFVSPTSSLRTGTLVVQAENEGEACKLAELKIPASQRELAKVIGATLYLSGPAKVATKR